MGWFAAGLLLGAAAVARADLHGLAFPTLPAVAVPPLDVALTGAPYTVAAGTSWVQFTQTGTLASETITLTAESPGALLDLGTIGSIQALSFSPAIPAWINGSPMPANSGLRLGVDASLNNYVRK